MDSMDDLYLPMDEFRSQTHDNVNEGRFSQVSHSNWGGPNQFPPGNLGSAIQSTMLQGESARNNFGSNNNARRTNYPKTTPLNLIPHYARPGTNDPPPPPRPAKPDSNLQFPPYDAPQEPPPRPAKPSFDDASILFKQDPSPVPPPRNDRRSYLPTQDHGIPGFRTRQNIQDDDDDNEHYLSFNAPDGPPYSAAARAVPFPLPPEEKEESQLLGDGGYPRDFPPISPLPSAHQHERLSQFPLPPPSTPAPSHPPKLPIQVLPQLSSTSTNYRLHQPISTFNEGNTAPPSGSFRSNFSGRNSLPSPSHSLSRENSGSAAKGILPSRVGSVESRVSPSGSVRSSASGRSPLPSPKHPMSRENSGPVGKAFLPTRVGSVESQGSTSSGDHVDVETSKTNHDFGAKATFQPRKNKFEDFSAFSKAAPVSVSTRVLPPMTLPKQDDAFPADLPAHEAPLPPDRTREGTGSQEVGQQDWYRPVSRERAKQLIEDAQRESPTNGCFIVRPGKGTNQPYSLTVCSNNEIYNFHIRRRNDGHFALGSKKENERFFPSVVDMITYYMDSELVLAENKGSVVLSGPP